MRNSVVMATYNGERYIIEQLNSIKNQTLPPDEVMIFDDCSTDATFEMIRKYIKQNNIDNWFVFENQYNKGFFNNFFEALKRSSGDIIYLADQDDVWDLNKLKKFTDLYKDNPDLMMIQSNFLFIDSTGHIIKKQEKYHGVTTEKILELSTFEMCRYAGSGYTMSFKRNVLDKVFAFGLEERKNLFLFHDIILGLTASSEGRCILVGDIIDHHRIHEDNVTKKKNKSYTSGRTKINQLDILIRRAQYFDVMANCTSDDMKRNVFLNFSKLSMTRESYINRFNVKDFVTLVKNRKMYASKVGVLVDSCYSIGLEKIVCLLAK